MDSPTESEIPTPDFGLLRLRRPDSSKTMPQYWDVDQLDPERRASLAKWWAFCQEKDGKDFDRWWKLQQSRTKCCGCKVISKSDSVRPDGLFRCLTCEKPRTGTTVFRPCLRLRHIVEGDTAVRVVEVMPEKGKSGLEAFGYWSDKP